MSTPSEVANVSEKLLAHQWIRNVVKSEHYTIATLSGQRLTMTSTNQMLNSSSAYYMPGVKGIKTGSLDGNYNLAILYTKNEHDYLLVSLGSMSEAARYDDLINLISAIS